jgi:large subunit ribosomal protein L16
MLFEIAGVSEATARSTLARVASKMPVRCRFVKRRVTV